MNESRFFWFFLYLIDLRNNAKEKTLRTLLDPKSEERKRYCQSLQKIILSAKRCEEVEPVVPRQPYSELENGTYVCNYCGKPYKMVGSLQKHLEKNHKIEDAICFTCKKCNKVFDRKAKLSRHQKSCQ